MSKRPAYFNQKNPPLSNYKIQECKEVFDILDKNHTGEISTDDIIKIKNIFSYPISGKNIQEMIKEIDIYGEGKFDFRKFITLIQRQIEYIDEIDEETILQSIKEDFGIKLLGNKRKRLAKNQYEEEIKTKNNVFPMINESVDSKDEVNTKREEGIDDGSSVTSDFNYNNINKKRKIDNVAYDIHVNNENDEIIENNSNKIIIENNNEILSCYGNNNNSNYLSDNYNNNIICKSSTRKKSNENKKSKIDIDIIDDNIIIIYKKYLSNDIIDEIEQTFKKDNYFPLIKFENNINDDDNINTNNNNINNNYQTQKPISSFCSSYFNSEYEFNNINNDNNSKEEDSFSFSSDCNSFNKALLSNGFLDKPPALNFAKLNLDVEDDLPIFGCERVIYENKGKDKDKDKDKNKNKDEENYKKTEIKVNKNRNNNNIQNNQNKSRNITNITNNNNNYNDNDKKYYYKKPKERERERELIKKETNQNKEKNIIFYSNNNIQILNTFVLEYKRNRKKERIIKKCVEIPYLIIIKKTAINMKEIQKYLNKNKNISAKKTNTRKNKDKMNTTIDLSSSNIFCYDNLNKTYIKNDSYINESFYRINEKRKKKKKNEDEIKSRTATKDDVKYNRYKERKLKDKKKNINNNYYCNYNPYVCQQPNLSYDKGYIDISEF